MTAQLDDYGCAHAARAEAPRNRPGQSEVSYGIGTQPEVFAALLDRLSRDPALAHLTTRAASDPAISLIDAWAMVLDILSFYQARIANEGWLRTATERRSVQDLARMVGYELNPGVAAQTWLAFTVQVSPGGGDVYPMPQGLKVQSIPGPGEASQLFETSALLECRVAFNSLRPRLTTPQMVARRTTALWLAGTATGVKPGDPILLVGSARSADPGSERWDLRIVTEVVADPAAGRTLLRWREDLGHSFPPIEPDDAPEIHAFDLRANLFGHAAPDFRSVPMAVRESFDLKDHEKWVPFAIETADGARIDLDREHAAILPGQWLILDGNGMQELYRVRRCVTVGRADYMLTGKVTRVTLDTTENLTTFGLRETAVLAASRALPRAEAPVVAPVVAPVAGGTIELDGDHPDLFPGQPLILRGRVLTAVTVAPRRHVQRIAAREVLSADPPLRFAPAAGGGGEDIAEGAVLTLLGPPVINAAGATVWPVALPDGRSGTVVAVIGQDLLPLPPLPTEAAFAPPNEALYAAERLVIRRINRVDGFAVLVLEAPLQCVYWRPSVMLNGNVVAATHGATRLELTGVLTGETYTETLGSGDSGRGMQTFRLSQQPLTHVQAATASGGVSTLVIKVDGLQWTELATLYGQPPDARVYATAPGPDGHLRVSFGDGVFGARLPAGQGNVVALYRVGIGLAGQVRAGQLVLPLDQPLGLQAVVNPLSATGAQDPEATQDARANAPLTVLTLDRIVSARDYEDFARAFAGIGKAQATPIWSGERQVLHLSATGADGSVLAAAGTTLTNLSAAIDAARHAERPVVVAGHVERRFGMVLQVKVAAGRTAPVVLAAVRAALEARYSAQGQGLAEGIESARVIAGAQAVIGVAAVVLVSLDSQPLSVARRIIARRARWSDPVQDFLPAELLVIDPTRLILEEILT